MELSALQNCLKKSTLRTSLEDRICFAFDSTNRRFIPDAVIDVGDADELVDILRFANENDIAIIPRGAGTGTTGGALAVNGGILLDLSKLDTIIAIDPERKIGIVETGVVTQDFDIQAQKYGLFYPPDPGSQKTSTLGGNVIENAGGLKCVKYGVTRNYVVGLEAFAGNGEKLLLGELNPNPTDFDESLIEIIISSEGTLAIITKIALRLMEKPAATETILASFSDVITTVDMVSEIFKTHIIPCTLEFIDASTLQCINEFKPIDVPLKNPVLLIEVDGEEAEVSDQADKIEEICRNGNAIRIKRERDPDARERLWELRRSISPALIRVAPTKVNEDIVIPRSNLPEMIKTINRLAKEYDLPILSFGHAGDGNLHVNIMTDKRDPERMERAKNAAEALFHATIENNGTLSGEHGIGMSKAPFMHLVFNDAEMAFQQKIKRAFDPNNILNPNKIFE